jgi:hypothetical protein
MPSLPFPLPSGFGDDEGLAVAGSNLKMYDFLIRPIRDADQQYGAEFVKRFLAGAQIMWDLDESKARSIPRLWSATDCPDEFLPYLKAIVGWSNEPAMKRITDALAPAALRRLIGSSVALWKQRGAEDAILTALRLVSTARCRMWNWFEFRWVDDETIAEETHQGRDPWVIDYPTSIGEQYWSNLRIVDDGTLDRTLVKDFIKIMRALSERIEVTYIDFLDMFESKTDDTQWLSVVGILDVSDGTAKLSNTALAERIITILPASAAWNNYNAYARVKSDDASGAEGVQFWFNTPITDFSNGLYVNFKVAQSILELYKYSFGIATLHASIDLTTLGIHTFTGVWYGLRVMVAPEVGGNKFIKVYFDGEEVISTVVLNVNAGRLGFGHDVGCTLEVDEVEMFQFPLDTDQVLLGS